MTNPADRRETVGQWQAADSATVEKALRNAVAAQPTLERARRPPAAPRSSSTPPTCSKQRMPQYLALCTKEAGKTLPDGVAEVREAVDFLRYYAAPGAQAVRQPEALPGPTGESNDAAAARPRRVRLHQPVELPAGDLRSARSPRRSPPATA